MLASEDTAEIDRNGLGGVRVSSSDLQGVVDAVSERGGGDLEFNKVDPELDNLKGQTLVG